MVWREQLQELSKKKKEEFEKDIEERRQVVERVRETIKICEPIIKEVANAIGASLCKEEVNSSAFTRWNFKITPADVIDVLFDTRCPGGDYFCVQWRRCWNPSWATPEHREVVPYSCYEDGNLEDKLREAIAKCIEAIHPG